MSRPEFLRKRIRFLTWIMILGLVLSGLTALPLQFELNVVGNALRLDPTMPLGLWLGKIREGLNATYPKYPFIAYGTDWLAFGHFMIAVAFVGALKDPVRNAWLFKFGMIACAAIVPYAFFFGEIRHIPIFWRLIDCSFGVVGFIPCWICARDARELDSPPSPSYA